MMDNHLEVADSYLNLASNYIELGKPEKARENLDTAYRIASHYQYYEATQLAFKIYSEYYSAVKNYEQAYVWLKKYENSKDSIMTEQSAREAEFDFDLPLETSGHAYAPKQQLHNLWLLISVFGLLIFVPLIFIRYKR